MDTTRILKATLSVVATIRVGWVKPLFTTFFTSKFIHSLVLFMFTKSIHFIRFVPINCFANLSHLVLSCKNVSVVRIVTMYFESKTLSKRCQFSYNGIFLLGLGLCTINTDITVNRSFNCIESLNCASRSHPDSQSTIVQMFYILRYPVVCSISFVWKAVVQLLGIFLNIWWYTESHLSLYESSLPRPRWVTPYTR